MKTILFGLPGSEKLTSLLAKQMKVEAGEFVLRQFPDGETYVRILSEVKNAYIILVCTLNKPNEKLLPLYFLGKTARSLGVKHICLVAPYLAYMRQDAIFNPGEGMTSEYFASLISSFTDCIVTVDPHLHRRHSLSEVYPIQHKVIHATGEISKWINENVRDPILIGPDSESEQWVSEVAKNAHVPFIVLNKIRRSDHDVEISIPGIDGYRNHTPILLDDIISTGATMIATVKHLKKSGMKPPVCIAVHAIFAKNAYQELLNADVKTVMTCNTIAHPSNVIDLSPIIAREIKKYIR